MSLKKAILYLLFRKVSAENGAYFQHQAVISTARNPHPMLFSHGLPRAEAPQGGLSAARVWREDAVREKPRSSKAKAHGWSTTP